jgi:hypothetical protein
MSYEEEDTCMSYEEEDTCHCNYHNHLLGNNVTQLSADG